MGVASSPHTHGSQVVAAYNSIHAGSGPTGQAPDRAAACPAGSH